MRTNKDPERGDVKVKGLSVFGAGRVRPTAKLFSRLDLYDPSDRTSEDGEILFIGGIDLVPVEDVHIMPNVIITTFQAPEMDAEVMPRITLYTKF